MNTEKLSSAAMPIMVCAFCDKATTCPVTCPRCEKLPYCSTKCESSHRAFHLFECEAKGPIDTVYYLVRACYASDAPEHPQTRIDYGFERASRTLGRHGEMMLCGLYRGLFVVMEVDPGELARWRAEGRLVENINAKFADVPRDCRGGYYAWFLENQYILDHTLSSSADAQNAAANKRIRAAWTFTGHSKKDSAGKIRAIVTKYAPLKSACFSLYFTLLSDWRYGPSMEGWLTFGFVATTSTASETALHRAYRELIGKCSFATFCQAYERRTIPALFQRHGISIPDARYFYDIMAPAGIRSSWFLKQYVEQKAGYVPGTNPAIPILVFYDYGYINCKKSEEYAMLDKLYAALFRQPDVDPIALFEACLKDRLLQYPYIAKYVNLQHHPRATYARLLQVVPSKSNGSLAWLTRCV